MLTLLPSQKDQSLITKNKQTNKKTPTWYICILLSYCKCFLLLFCLIVLQFLCINFSVLPIRFSECSVHFPCTEVANPQAPASSRRGLLLQPLWPTLSSPLTLPHSPAPFWVFLTSLPVSEASSFQQIPEKGSKGKGNTCSLASLEHLHPPCYCLTEAGCRILG